MLHALLASNYYMVQFKIIKLIILYGHHIDILGPVDVLLKFQASPDPDLMVNPANLAPRSWP
jgi:hypothetical protein